MSDGPNLLTLLTAQSGAALASDWFQVAYDEDHPYETRPVNIIITSPSWNAADVKIQACHDLTESPLQVGNVQVLSSLTMADLLLEAAATIPLLAINGVYYRVSSTDTGSPLTVLTATAKGPIVSAA